MVISGRRHRARNHTFRGVALAAAATLLLAACGGNGSTTNTSGAGAATGAAGGSASAGGSAAGSAGGSGSGGGGASAPGGPAQLDQNGFLVRGAGAQKGGVVTILGNSAFSHLDPARGNDGNVVNFYNLLYRTLTMNKRGPNAEGAETVPDLATDLGKPNKDATVWTFTLKKGISYADGTPIKAADFKFGFERALDPKNDIGNDELKQLIKGADKYEGIYSDPKGLDSIETPDDSTIVFHLNRPFPSFFELTSSGPLTPFPKSKVTSVDYLDTNTYPSGPYQIKSNNPGVEVVLERNPKWDPATDPNRAAYPDGFDFKFGIDPATLDQRMIAGQAGDQNTIASSTNPLQPSSVGQIQQPQIKARTVRDLPSCTYFMNIRTDVKPLDNPKVRQAIEYAIDKQALVTAAGGPLMAIPAGDMLLPGVPNKEAFDLFPSTDSKGDPDKAKQLLSEAGVGDGIELKMDVRGLPLWQGFSNALQDSLSKVGIKVTQNPLDSSKYYDVIQTPAQQSPIQVTGWCSSWLNGYPLLSPLFDGKRITKTGNQNGSMLNDPAINKRFADIAAITDADQQNAEYVKLDKEIMQLAPVVPMVWLTPLQMVGSNVGNAFACACATGYIDYSSVGLINPAG